MGSVTINNLGSLKILVFWLVKVPGVHLEEEVEMAPTNLENLKTALCPETLDETTITSYGLSTAAIALAANWIFYQVSSKLKIWIPSLFLWEMNLFMWKFKF